jgi:pimeloyl-ACP methyl ester carboxylesterase
MWTEVTLPLRRERSLRVRQSGAGRDVVFLHGALATGHDWSETPLGDLAGNCRLTIVDRPGHGGSRRPRLDGTPRDQARQILAGLEALGIVSPLVVAHSFGGIVALAMAEAAALAGLVLVAPVCFPEPRLVEHGLLAPRAIPIVGPFLSAVAEATRFDRALLDLIQRKMFAPQAVPAHWRATFPWAEVEAAMVAEGEDAAAILPLSPAGTIDMARVGVPVHVLTGTADGIVQNERQGKALARLLPQARLTEIEGAGHMLHHTHPAPLLAAIRDIAR